MYLTFFIILERRANLVSERIDYASVSQPVRVQVKGLGYWLFLVETRQDETGEEFLFSRDFSTKVAEKFLEKWKNLRRDETKQKFLEWS